MENKRLFILKSLEAGGAETYLLRYLSFDSDKNNVVLCMSGKGGQLEREYETVAGIEKNIRLGLFNPFQYFKLYKYLRKNQFSVVSSFAGNFSGWIMLSAKMAGIQNRITFYRESRNQFKPTVLKTAYANLMKVATGRFSTRVLANSHAALDYFHPEHEENAEKFKVIYNGFDRKLISTKTKEEMRDALGIPREAFVIGHTGRLAWAKNHDMMMSCAIELCRTYRDVVFVFVGRDVDIKYQESVASEKLEGQIKLLGYRTDVLDVLKAFDLYYFPSLSESQPNALIEAMCTGLPFIASDIPAIREAVPGECLQYLVSPIDKDANLSSLHKAYHQKKRYFNFPIASWAIEKYDSEKLFNQFKKVLS